MAQSGRAGTAYCYYGFVGSQGYECQVMIHKPREQRTKKGGEWVAAAPAGLGTVLVATQARYENWRVYEIIQWFSRRGEGT